LELSFQGAKLQFSLSVELLLQLNVYWLPSTFQCFGFMWIFDCFKTWILGWSI